MSKTNLTIAFDGPALDQGRMDVRDLAPALLALGRAIEASSHALNGSDHPVKIEAIATKVGSFEINIDVVLPLWETLRGLLTSSDVDGALKLIEIIGFIGTAGGGGLIWLLRQLKGRSISSVSNEKEGYVKVKFPGSDGNETSVVVSIQVLRLYQEKIVLKEISNLLHNLENENIEKITFISTEKSKIENYEPLVLTKADRIIADIVDISPEIVTDQIRTMALSIRSLAFQEGNKWRLFDGQNIITATIEDRNFLDRIDNSLERFAKGDLLICEVRTLQMQTTEGLKTEHTVLKVDEHRAAPTQLTIQFD